MSAERELLPVASGAETRRAVLALLAERRARAAATLLVLVAGTGAGLLVPPILGHIVNVVAEGRPAGDLTAPIVLLLAASIVGGVLTGAGIALVATLTEPLLATLRERVVDRVLELPQAEVERAGTGDLVARVGDDVAEVATALRDALPALAASALTVGLTVVGLAALDLRLALAGLCAAPIQIWALRWYLRSSAPVYREQRRAASALAQQLLEALGGRATIRALRLGPDQERLVAARSSAAVDLALRGVWLATRFFGRLNVAELTGATAILCVSFLLVRSDAIDVGTATAAALYFLRLFDPINVLLGLFDEAQAAAASLARLVGVAERPVADGPARAEDGARPEIRLEGVHFAYVPGHEVLHGVDLAVAAGERLALVGPSGSGKSTLARLIAGIERPGAGTLDAGGEVALVTQEVHVFAGPLADDLRLVRPGATEAELEAALRRAGALDWVRRLPERLATVVGAGGHPLTATQAQQIGLARVALAGRPVVVLDEATADAGSAGARVLERAADEVLRERTALVVAHRLSQAAGSDRVAVLEAGRVVELGPHDELLRAGGGYARLWNAWRRDRGSR